MIPVAVLMDRISMLSQAIVYERLTHSEVSWVQAYIDCKQNEGPVSEAKTKQKSMVVFGEEDEIDVHETHDEICVYLCEELSATMLSGLGKNVIVVETDMSKLSFVQELQACALDIMNWEHSLDEVALNGGTVQDFLDASEETLQNFIDVSDSSFRLIAYTTGISIDDPTVCAFIERGYHDEESVAKFKRTKAMDRWRRQRKSVFHPAGEGMLYPFINYVFRVNGSYFMQMVMECNNDPFTPGLLAKFNLLAKHIQRHIRQFDNLQEHTFGKESSFLIDLLQGRRMETPLLQQRASRLQLPLESRLRLYLLTPNTKGMDTNAWTAQRIADYLPECFVVPFEHRIVVVSPRRNQQEWLDDARIEAILAPIAGNDGYALSASGIVPGLEHLTEALHQAQAALDAGVCQPWKEGRPALYHFELTFVKYALGPHRPAFGMLKECARHSILGSLMTVDEERGSGDSAADFLLTYYDNHCSVTATSRALDVHRNTVANRLHALEEHFNTDFQQPELELNLRLCSALLR